MFVVCFGDGLGNQMFQYAFYKSIQKAYPESVVKMDIFRIYGGQIHNGFELDRIFGIKKDECSRNTAYILSDYLPNDTVYNKIANKFFSVRRYLYGKKDSFITQDDPTCYYPDVYRLSTNYSYMFKGNWVNEKYFCNIREELFEDFKFPVLDSDNLKYLKEIEDTNSVSVHLRLGDYINSGMINLTENYYVEAKKIISQKVENPSFFIFSDDKEFAKRYSKLFNNATIITTNTGKDSYKDMHLMSLCKHNIIANSTFSFWGAYLNRNKNKVVVSPNKAKADFKNPFSCEGWVKIDI